MTHRSGDLFFFTSDGLMDVTSVTTMIHDSRLPNSEDWRLSVEVNVAQTWTQKRTKTAFRHEPVIRHHGAHNKFEYKNCAY